LIVAKEIPLPSGTEPRKPSFVVFNYSLPSGLFKEDYRNIEISLREVERNTIVSLKWFYSAYEGEEDETASLVEEFKSRVGATEVTTDSVKEIIKEKTVIVKVRCPYCSNLYDEALDKCPHCGGKR
jgi:hypothetical protein